jgi:hypothetical protein
MKVCYLPGSICRVEWKDYMKNIKNRTRPTPSRPTRFSSVLPPQPPRRGGREGAREGLLKLQWSYFLADSAPHAENTHFTSQTGVRGECSKDKSTLIEF